MKRILAVAVAVLLSGAQAHAASTCGRPIPQGTWELGTSTRLNYNKANIEYQGVNIVDADIFEADLDLAYYLIDNVALGGFVYYDYEKVELVEFFGDAQAKYETTLFGPEVIWNFCAEERAWFPFNLYLKLGGGYASWRRDTADGDGWGANFDAGLKFFLHEAVSVNLFYNYKYFDMSDDTTVSAPGVGLGLSFYKLGM